MDNQQKRAIEDAFNSMLRSDYIPLKDTEKLVRLADYYVDYLGFLREVVGESDHLIVGRRGTGKTTLLYRGLIETINSWRKSDNLAKPKTLGIYLDLSKCHSLEDTASKEFSEFEHVFTTELFESVKAELSRTWPELKIKPGLLARVFSPKEIEAKNSTNSALDELARILSEGVLRSENKSGPQKIVSLTGKSTSYDENVQLKAKANPEASAGVSMANHENNENSVESTSVLQYRLNISDILRALNSIREAAGVSHIVIFIDEFSSLTLDLQRRFSTLLRKVLGNHSGVFVKISAITDNYTLGSSIILQRDLFELNLDLDSYVERSGTLGSAMKGLSNLTRNLIDERVSAYAPEIKFDELFEDIDYAIEEMSKAAMGVPRTVGIILKQSLSRNLSENIGAIRKSDIDYGIRYASRAYLNQFEGSCGVAIPSYYKDIWDALLEKAILERAKNDSTSSHFMVLPRNEIKLKYFNMFFISHLLTQGRTTKKDKASRSLYCFDYGVCIENNMLWGIDKNVIRQQRFAYDSILEPFDHYFERNKETHWRCPTCDSVYKEKELNVAGNLLGFCPKDKADLVEVSGDDELSKYTEEEIKIVGAIRSSNEEDELLARHVADDVGCYVQKVAKFGEKLEREEIIKRKMKDRYIYFSNE
ncbi:hypothetical protein SAMN02745148_01060 [Modicisalibacter ilicicola DSM 19980]|uniref:Uncharacterized protein n=1 Tax=Modicisalibacter ilicicola DSM 19980 TaxID=1121942 RepID=A0A1M4W3D5_9GAMM|nr:hypothetical protein [Halomonas ilicicola]SHE75719.1 hypothetical protein SAMN02745148_01060 [Halomonas ilicicola DSM 19980]